MTAAERDGRRLVVSVMGAEPVPLRAADQAALLLDWGFGVPPSLGRVGTLVGSAADVPPPPSSAPAPAPGPAGAAAGPAVPPAADGGGPPLPGLLALGVASAGLLVAVSARRRAARRRPPARGPRPAGRRGPPG